MTLSFPSTAIGIPRTIFMKIATVFTNKNPLLFTVKSHSKGNFSFCITGMALFCFHTIKPPYKFYKVAYFFAFAKA
nr:hypothetical protein [uncultured bacterium]